MTSAWTRTSAPLSRRGRTRDFEARASRQGNVPRRPLVPPDPGPSHGPRGHLRRSTAKIANRFLSLPNRRVRKRAQSLPRADGPLGAAPRAPAADPADDGITTVTVTLREDSRGGATHALSRKREDARLGDDDDVSRGDPPRASRVSTGACFADSFPEWTERSDDGALSLSRGSDLLPNDDAWNAVLTAFEAHCLRGEDGADRGDEALRQNAARFESEETPSDGVFARADSPARVGASRSCADGLPFLPSPLLCVDHAFIDAPISTRDPHESNGSNADRMDKQSRVRANASAAETKLPSDEVFDNLASDLPSSPTPVTAAERVRAHAARALRSLIFGRDDGRGRRRSALEGPRVSRRGAKPKSVRSRSRKSRSPEDVSGTPDERFDADGLDFDFDDVLDPDVDPRGHIAGRTLRAPRPGAVARGGDDGVERRGGRGRRRCGAAGWDPIPIPIRMRYGCERRVRLEARRASKRLRGGA